MGKQALTPKKIVKKIQKKFPQALSAPSSPSPSPSSSPRNARKTPESVINDAPKRRNQKRTKSDEQTKEKIILKRKKNKSSSKQNEKTSSRLAPELFERLSSVINIADIETNGFPQELWNSLSFEEKNSLPIFVSILFRSSETKEERKRNQKQKQVINGIILKYQKQALHRYYLMNKKKIKKLQVEKEISGNKATELLWNLLSPEEKNEWYRQTTLEVERKQQKQEVEGEEEGEEESDSDSEGSDEEEDIE
jgi:hypothetical protein